MPQISKGKLNADDSALVEYLHQRGRPTSMALFISSFGVVVRNFLGSRKAENFVKLATEMISNFRKLGCNLSIKITQSLFPWKQDDTSEGQVEILHQNIENVEDRYQERWMP